MYFVLCNNENCKETIACFRFMSTPEENQRYEPFTDCCGEENNYKMFIKIRKGDKIKNAVELFSINK